MSHYSGNKPNEIFLGNVEVAKFPLNYLSSLKTLRIGEQAYDIEGKPIDRDDMRPMFIDRSEHDAYGRIMMSRFSKIARGLPVDA